MTKKRQEPEAAGERVSIRLEEPISTRFLNVVTVSRRTKTSVIEECLAEQLPRLEKKYLTTRSE